jgi:hypothetical protein
VLHAVPYVQVLARSRRHPTWLIVRDEDGQTHLWFGDRPGSPLESLPADLAAWLRGQPGVIALADCAWVALADLPVGAGDRSASPTSD